MTIATAPVSFGVYGLGQEGGDPEALLEAMASAGFAGTELGPPGYLGAPSDLASRLERHGLRAAGVYAPIRFGDPRWIEPDFSQAERSLAELAASGNGQAPLILADGGADALLANPARPWWDRTEALEAVGWRRLVEVVKRFETLAAEAGVPLSFHPHISTYVESVWEVERLLALTEVGLTLDTGHLYLAGAAAKDCLRAWKDRINHIHVKDVHVDVLTRAREIGRIDFDQWWPNVPSPLGEGDVDLIDFVAELRRTRYRGWLVIEQDRRPGPPGSYPTIAEAEARNRAWLVQQLGGSDETKPL
ncbi:MAG: sugar phosphate isomerase/epimerase family protein [Acidimicrobiia bacterium]